MRARAQFRESATLLAFPRAAQSLRGFLSEAFRRHRLPDLLTEELICDAAAWTGYEPVEALTCALEKRMRTETIDFQGARGILLLGPSGAGKSAVAAKLVHAARLTGRRTELAGASDGLALFRTGTHLGDSLTVMEAAGFNPVNPRAASAFAALGEIEGVDTIGVLSAASDAQDNAEIVASLRLKRVIVTGLDRTLRLGATVAAITGGARLAHVTYGPREDDALDTLQPAMLARLLLEPAH